MNTFKQLPLSEKILSVLEELRFSEPTDIQAQTIPKILAGKDLIGNAATGSGKTLAFASGIIEKTKPGEGIQALVLAPTRELAIQIATSIRTFSKQKQLTVEEVYGGVSFDNQAHRTRHADVIVGTPGRILDHLEKQTFDFSKLTTLVLDEADRMVDMGFLKDVEAIINACPKKRQTLLFSATTSPDVEYIAKKHMNNPEFVVVERYVDPSLLTQEFYDTPKNMKFSLIVHFLRKEKSGTIMVFCNTRRNVDMLADNLKRYKIKSQAIHGGLDQNKRTRIIEKLHNKEADILICTDVAARGLDIKGVTHVYNYDIPNSPDEYIHRIGRTARAGKNGKAISIVTQRDYDNFRRVMQDDSLNIEQKDLPEVEKCTPKFQRDTRDNGRRSFGNNRGRSNGGYSRDNRNSDTNGRRRSSSSDSRGGRRNETGGGRRFGGNNRRSDNTNGRRRTAGGSRDGRRSSGPSRGNHRGPRDSGRRTTGKRNHGRRERRY